MLTQLLKYLPLALEIVGIASVAAIAAKPLVERTANRWDNKLVWAIGKLYALLGTVALNPKK